MCVEWLILVNFVRLTWQPYEEPTLHLIPDFWFLFSRRCKLKSLIYLVSLYPHIAGDLVKFGLPMASSATLIIYGMEFIKEGYDIAGQYDMAMRQVRWALEYFRKCSVDKDKFYAQVEW